MKKKHFLAALFFPLCLSADTVVFNKTFGGSGNDFAYSIQPTTDGGYIVAGQTESFGNGSAFNPDIWIIKLDSAGNVKWDRTFGESGKGDGALSVCQTIDEGYVVAGTTSSYSAEYPSMWIIKLDSGGNSVWTRIYQGSYVSSAYSVGQTTDGGYVVAGKGEENILKLDSVGNKVWGKRFSRIFYSVSQTADGGYIAAGDSIYQQLEWNYIPSVSIIKLDRNGNKEWNNPLGDDFTGRAYCIQQTSDGGYVVAGDSIDFKPGNEHPTYLMVIKLDENGNREWSYFGGDYSDAQSIRQTADDGYVVAGNTRDEGNGLDLALIKLDKNGKEEWMKEYGSIGGWEYASSARQTDDGGYIVAGQTDSYGQGFYDMWILKLDENGDGPGVTGGTDYGEDPFKGYALLQNYPNPLIKETTFQFSLPEPGFVTLAVYSMQGKKMETIVSRQFPAGEFHMNWNAENLPGGIYFYRLQAGPFIQSRMLTLQK